MSILSSLQTNLQLVVNYIMEHQWIVILGGIGVVVMMVAGLGVYVIKHLQVVHILVQELQSKLTTHEIRTNQLTHHVSQLLQQVQTLTPSKSLRNTRPPKRLHKHSNTTQGDTSDVQSIPNVDHSHEIDEQTPSVQSIPNDVHEIDEQKPIHDESTDILIEL